jgi:hypothetical protein
MTDMGPDSLKNVIARDFVASLQLMEIANFLNGRERFFVQERRDGEKKMKNMEKNYKKMEAELKKARLDFQELAMNFDAYRDKHVLQVELTQTLLAKEEEADRLAAKVAELEGQLQKLSISDEEEKKVDPKGEFTNFSRGSLIKELIDAQNSVVFVTVL